MVTDGRKVGNACLKNGNSVISHVVDYDIRFFLLSSHLKNTIVLSCNNVRLLSK